MTSRSHVRASNSLRSLLEAALGALDNGILTRRRGGAAQKEEDLSKRLAPSFLPPGGGAPGFGWHLSSARVAQNGFDFPMALQG